jgi:large repetitive protein
MNTFPNKNQTKIVSQKTILKLLSLLLFAFHSYGEGTKELSPNSTKITSLYFSPSTGVGSNFNAASEDRIYFKIGNHTTENFYFGVGNCVTSNNPNTSVTDAYYRILNSAGTVVKGPTLLDRTQIDTHAKALAGANINGTAPTGYTPLVFDPTANDDYYIEIYRSSNAGATSSNGNFNIPFFDFQVATAAGSRINGRVYAEKWSFRATSPTTNWRGDFTDYIDPTLYTFTADQTVVKVQFTDFQPLAFVPAFNSYGVNSDETDWFIGRRSVTSGATSPTLVGGFKTFLNQPDGTQYPPTALATAPTINGKITGCPGEYLIPYFSNVNGDVRFLLDLNGVAGFQAGTADVILEQKDVVAGNNFMPWDGKNGLGVAIAANSTMNSTISMLRGRINMPVYDAEVNSKGFQISAVSPASVSVVKMYWDDSHLTNITGNGTNLNNTTGPGIDNSINGQASPGHAWNGAYGTTLITPPATATTDGNATTDASDDFGNLRTINTWFWGLEEQSGSLNIRLPYCLSISGTVYQDGNALKDNLINGVGSNAGGLYAYLVDSTNKVVAIDTVTVDGFYGFNKFDSGNYKVRISNLPGQIGNTPPAIELPIGFNLTGEGIASGGDGIIDGETAVKLVATDISGVLFGINKAPESNPASVTLPNPSGTNQVTVPTVSGSDSEDGALGANNRITIKVLPVNAILYYDGVAVIEKDTIFNYDPTLLTLDPSFENAGMVTFQYAFVDNANMEDPTPATVTVNFVASSPVATDDEKLNNIGGSTVTLNIIGNDKIADAKAPLASEVKVDLNSTLTGVQDSLVVSGEGVWTYDSLTGNVSFKPAVGITNNPTDISYIIIEKLTGLSDTAKINIEYIPPVANNDEQLAILPGDAVSVNILANDKLSDNSTANPSAVIVDLNPSLSGVQDTLKVVGEGVWTYNPATGVLTFTPEAGFTTDPTDITYQITEKSTGLKDLGVLNIEYQRFPPIAIKDENLGNAPGNKATLNILTNDMLSDSSAAILSKVRVDVNIALAGEQTTYSVPNQGVWAYDSLSGKLTFTPEIGFTTDPSDIIYSLVEKSTGLSDTTIVRVGYIEVNPYAKYDQSLANTPGKTVVLNLLTNDLLSDSSAVLPSRVRVDLNENIAGVQTTLIVPNEGVWKYDSLSGNVTFTPEAGFTIHPTVISYTLIEKLTGLRDNALITIQYLERPPYAKNDESLGNTSGASVVLNLLTNDKLSDSTAAQASKVMVDLNLSIAGVQITYVVAGQGIWSYDSVTGNASFMPEVTFTLNPTDIPYVLIEKLTGLSDTAMINVEYLPPAANNDQNLGNTPGQAVSVNILANDKLSDNSPVSPNTVTVDLNPALPGVQDTLIVSGEGIWTYVDTTGVLTFTPYPGFTANPTDITYVLTDKSNGLSDEGLLNIEYLQYPPIAIKDENLGNTPGKKASLHVLANDMLSDSSVATPSKVQVDLNLTMAGTQNSLTVINQGVWAYDSLSGILLFTPEAGFTTDPSVIIYNLIAKSNGLSDTSTVKIIYTEIPPFTKNDESLANKPGKTVVLNIISNDKLSDSTAAVASKVRVDLNPSLAGVQTVLTVTNQGVWSYDSLSGNVTFAPEAGFTIDPTDISYALIEKITGLSSSALINVEYTEMPPYAKNDESLGNKPGDTVILNIISNDKLSDSSAIVLSKIKVDLNPSLSGIQNSLTVANQGIWTYDSLSGNVSFIPSIGFTTDPTDIPYLLIEKITGLSAQAIINVEYTEVPPKAKNDESLANKPGKTVVLNILTNDKLSDSTAALPTRVRVDLNTSLAGVQTMLTVTNQGVWSYDSLSGNVSFVPAAGFTTDPTDITYSLIEKSTGLSSSALINVEYTEVAPKAFDDSKLANAVGTVATLNILTNDKLSDSTAAVASKVRVDLNTTLSGVQTSLTVASQGVWAYDSLTGNVSFTPAINFTTDPTDITYSLIEKITGLSSNAIIHVDYLEKAPIANNDSKLDNDKGTTVTLPILANDTLSNKQVASRNIVTVDLNPTLVGNQNTLTVNNQGVYSYSTSTGLVTFTPSTSLAGNPTPIKYVLIENSNMLSDTALITVTYKLEMIANEDQSNSNTPGQSAQLNIVSNDTLSNGVKATPGDVIIDLDPNTVGVEDTLKVPYQGTWIYNPVTGVLTFKPENGFSGNPDPIQYLITEKGTGANSQASVTVMYIPVPPVAVNDVKLGNLPQTPVSLNIVKNDILADGTLANETLVYVDLDLTKAGNQDSFKVNKVGVYVYNSNTGMVTFKPDTALKTNPAPIQYILIEKSTFLTDTATITLTFAEPVVATNDQSVGNTLGTPVSINIIQNDSLSNDSKATPSSVIIDLNPNTPAVEDTLKVPGQGTWVYVPATGVLTFTPEVGFTSDPTPITYLITDKTTFAQGTATITVDYVQANPVANSDQSLNNLPMTNVILDILLNDKLSDNSQAVFGKVDVDLNLASAGVQHSLTVIGEGTYIYNPANGRVTFSPTSGYYKQPSDKIYSLIETGTGQSDTAKIKITYTYTSLLELTKTAVLFGKGYVGDTIEYTFSVVNKGNVPVSNLSITDTLVAKTPLVLTPSVLQPAGIGTAKALYILKLQDVLRGTVTNTATVNGQDPNSLVVSDVSDNGNVSQPGNSDPTILYLPQSYEVDLKLTQNVDGNCKRQIGDTITYTLVVQREDTLNLQVTATIKDSLGVNLRFISANATSGTYNSTTKMWSGLSLGKNGKDTLVIKALVLTSIGGTNCNVAWVQSSNYNDVDSTPGDQDPTEDDYSKACISVPIQICAERNESALLAAEAGHTSYQWYKDGQIIQGATSVTYSAIAAGQYTITVDGNTCNGNNCCPIYVEENCVCPPKICIPITIKKIQK